MNYVYDAPEMTREAVVNLARELAEIHGYSFDALRFEGIMANEIREHVEHVANSLDLGTDAEWCREWHESPDHCHGFDGDDETLDDHLEWCDLRPGPFDWLDDALEVQCIVSSEREFLGARVLVTVGGPNIWVDTYRGLVEGAWGADSYSAHFDDALGLNEALQDLWEMGA